MFRSLFSICGVKQRPRRRDNNTTGTQQPSQRPLAPSASTSQLLTQGLRQAFPDADLPRPGFFAGASHVDASYGVFTDIAGDLNIKVEAQDNDLFFLEKLPHAKAVGYQYVNHEECLTGTRRAELQRIEDWEADYTDKRVYWLNGIAGCGKSTISKTFAQRSSTMSRLGASFFCSRDFDDRRNINLIFPTLAYNLAFQYPEFKAALIPIISSSPNIGHALPATQLECLLVRPLKSTGLHTTIIIDALDECEDHQPASAILSLLAQHVHSLPFVKFFITGRPEPPIRSGFRLALLRPYTEVFVLHDVDQVSVDLDIELYLRGRLSKIVAERSDCDLTTPWPTDKDISTMVQKSSSLFIVAFVITEFIASRHHKPQKRLEIIISNPDSTVLEGKSGIDGTYEKVFLQSFEDVDVDDDDFLDELRLVVASVVLAFNPLSCANLATILDIPRASVRSAIRSLHSVLKVPVSDSQPLLICHKSLADFITDVNRCTEKRFYVDPFIYHLKLGTLCLELMNKSLKRNMCDLPPYVMNDDISDLGERRERYIGGGLEYACRYWARHLHFASKDGKEVKRTVGLLEHFFEKHLLSWLEVLSIVGDMSHAVYSLRDVKAWLVDVGSQDESLLNIIKDGERFILRFFDVIGASACHIYHSALPWCPASSLVRALYQHHISTDVKLLNAIDDTWNACTRAMPIQSTTRSIAFSHKDDLIAVGEDNCVEIFEAATGRCRATLTGIVYTDSLAFFPDDTLLVNGCHDGTLNIWDLQTGSLVRTLPGHTDDISSLAFSPCGTMIASASADHTIRIWNLSSYDCRVLEGHSHWVTVVCWSTKENEVISGSLDGTIRVWDISEMKCLKTFSGYTDQVWSAATSPDSSSIAVGCLDGMVKIINARDGAVLQTIPTHRSLESIRFMGQDRLICVTQRTFQIWDLAKNANALMFEYDGYQTAISSDGTCIASGSSDFTKVVNVWQIDGNRSHDVASPNHHSSRVNSVAFSGDGKLIASGAESDDNTVKLWDPATGLCLETFHDHTNFILLVTFSPDSALCASEQFGAIYVWDVHSRSLVSILKKRVQSVRINRFSLDGRLLVSLCSSIAKQSEDSVILWDVATGRCLAWMDVDGHFPNVAFGVDGTSIILKRDDSSVMKWEISPAPTSTQKSFTDNQSSDADEPPADDNQSSDADEPPADDNLPMVFVPTPGTQLSVFPSLTPPHQYHHEQSSEWILDEQKRRVCWVLPDLRGAKSDCHGKRVVFGSITGRVTIVDFSDV